MLTIMVAFTANIVYSFSKYGGPLEPHHRYWGETLSSAHFTGEDTKAGLAEAVFSKSHCS